MSYSITEVKNHLIGMGHGGTLNKIRNFYPLVERAGNNMRAKVNILETIRIQPLVQTVHSDVFNYTLPADFDKPIDLIPEDSRAINESAARILALPFDLQKSIQDKKISIEGSEGTKYMRINWRFRTPKLLNSMDSLTANGAWTSVGTASGLTADTIYKQQGSASIRFNTAASGDGIQNITMTAVDLTNESTVGDFYVPVYLPAITGVTSLTAVWGNDLTTKFWTGVAQTTQADGTAFRIGWNLLRYPWATATQTGTVAPASIDSFKITIAATVPLTNVRVDNITCSIGRPFDLKYYSKYLFKNSAGTYLQQPTTDDDVVICDSDSINIFLYECLIAMAQQMEGTDSAFDIGFASKALFGDLTAHDEMARAGLYSIYRGENPTQNKKAAASYGSLPRIKNRFRRGSW